MQAYRKWIPSDWRIVVLVDEDRQDCRELKERMERFALDAGFATKSSPVSGNFCVLNRIAIEELEAWFLGDVDAVVAAYPRAHPGMLQKPRFQDPDSVTGGTAEALQRVLKRAGYYRGGMPKIEVARTISALMDPARNRSRSFKHFWSGLQALSPA